MCGGEKFERHVGSFKDKMLGLPGLTLLGVQIQTCKTCGEEYVSIPRVEQLHKLVVSRIVGKRGRLTGPEIRYLRKYIGWSGTDFARHFGVQPETVSRWENDKDLMGPVADRLLRVAVTWKKPIASYQIENLLDTIQNDRAEPLRIRVKQKGNDWTTAA